MDKYYGKVGYGPVQIETAPDVWEDSIVEREYYGDVRKNAMSQRPSESVNDDLAVNVIISIVSDPYAYSNFHKIRYIEWMGSKWKISSALIKSPRIELTLGGLYNG